MSFTDARDFQTTLNSLLLMFIATGTPITDLRPGGIIHSFLSTVAMAAVRTNEDLTALVAEGQTTAAYTAFGFGTQPAQAAYGAVTLTASPLPTRAIAIPIGTLFGLPGTTLQFRSTSAVTLAAGTASVSVPVIAGEAGRIGNVGSGAISQILSPLVGITAVTNPQPLTTGKDAQSDGDRRQAFRDYLATLHRGTKQAIAVGAAAAQIVDAFGVPIERVTKVLVSEAGAGALVAIYGMDVVASPALVAACQSLIDGSPTGDMTNPGFRAAGTRVTAVAVAAQPVIVQVLVRLAAGFTLSVVEPLIVDAVTTVFRRLEIGENLTPNRLRTAIGILPGISEFVLQLPAFTLYADGSLPTSTSVGPTPPLLLTLVPFLALGAPPTSSDSWVGLY